MPRTKRCKRSSISSFLQRYPSKPGPELSPEIVCATDSEDEDDPEKSIIEVDSPDRRCPPTTRQKLAPSLDNLELSEYSRQPLTPVRAQNQSESRIDISSRLRSVAVHLEFGDDDPETSISEVRSPIRRKLVRSTKTIRKQLETQATQIELEVVICHIWKGEDAVQVLVKDSEDFLSLLVIPTQIHDELLQCLATGMFFRFRCLTLLQKVTTKISMPLFSILAAFGYQQRIYYKLIVSSESKWDVLQCLDIHFTGIHDGSSPTLFQLIQLPKNEDCRVIVTGKLRAESRWTFYLQEGEAESQFDIQLKITVLSSFQYERISRINFDQPVKLTFLRYFRGLANLDQFSSIEQV